MTKKISLSGILFFAAILFSVAVLARPVNAEAKEPYLFFREQLLSFDEEKGEDLVKAYDAISEAISKREETITPEVGLIPADSGTINELIFAVSADHPEYFWLENVENVYAKVNPETGSGYVSSIEVKYFFPANELTQRKNEFDVSVHKFTSGIKKGMSDYEIEKTIYENIIEKVDYVDNAPYNQSAYSAMVNGESVCEGYVEAMKYLLSLYDIDSIQVSGKVKVEGGFEDHAWLLVNLDGDYYQADVTWDDVEDAPNYRFFNLTDKMMLKDRSFFPDTADGFAAYKNLPKCTETKYNYYAYSQKFGRSLYVKEGKEDKISISDIASAINNPVDGWCKFYAEDPVAFKSYLSNNKYEIMEASGLLSNSFTGYITSLLANEIRFIPVRAYPPDASPLYEYPVYGTVLYDGSLDTELSVSICTEAGQNVYTKKISGRWNSFAAYSLESGKYIVTVTDGKISTSQEITVSKYPDDGILHTVNCKLELRERSLKPEGEATVYGTAGDDLSLCINVNYEDGRVPVMHYTIGGKEEYALSGKSGFTISGIPFFKITDKLNIYFTDGIDGEKLDSPKWLPDNYLDYLTAVVAQAKTSMDSALISFCGSIVKFAYELQKAGAAPVTIVPADVSFFNEALNETPGKMSEKHSKEAGSSGRISEAVVNILDQAAFKFKFDIPDTAVSPNAVVTGPNGNEYFDLSETDTIIVKRISPFDYDSKYKVMLYVNGKISETLSDYSINTYCSKLSANSLVKAFYNYGLAARRYAAD